MSVVVGQLTEVKGAYQVAVPWASAPLTDSSTDADPASRILTGT